MKALPGKLFPPGQSYCPKRQAPSRTTFSACSLAALLLLSFEASTALAGISSLYVFGDSVSTTTNNVNPSVAYLYYGHRFCNGRVWVERLAERQGLTYQPSKNWSYFGHYSTDLLANIDRFSAQDAATSLFVVWVSDADFVQMINNIDPPYRTNVNLGLWNTAINQSLTNHARAIQRLYAKGARTFIMPNAVDLSKVPYYVNMDLADRRFIWQRVTSFNAGFGTVVAQAKTSLPDITIHVPDFYALLEDIHAHPSDYGLIKPGIDAIGDPALGNKSLNGPGANYIWWDYLNPTAKSQTHMVDVAQQMLSPVRIEKLTVFQGSNRLDIANVPIGRNGVAERSADMVTWTTASPITSTNTAQSVYVSSSDPGEFYRTQFPFSWTWP